MVRFKLENIFSIIMNAFEKEIFESEEGLEVVADQDGTIDGYIGALYISDDAGMKAKYVQKALELLKTATPNRYNCDTLYLLCKKTGDTAAINLLQEMIFKCPSMDVIEKQIMEEMVLGDSEAHLRIIADHDGSIAGYAQAWRISDDAGMKVKYFLKIQNIVENNPTIPNYREAYRFCIESQKYTTAQKLVDEMMQKHPWIGRLYALEFMLLSP
jgi:hypothetical protein